MILYHTRTDGSFIAGCTETGITAEAMPGSMIVWFAASDAVNTAKMMISAEKDYPHIQVEIETELRAKDAGRMAELLAHTPPITGRKDDGG